MAITNYETSWEGMTGLDVETFIKDKLQANETAANALTQNGVVRIVAAYKNAGQPDEDQTTIVITGFNAAGDVVTTSEFSTITQASYTQHIQELGRNYACSNIVAKGQDLSIPYDYYVQDENGNKVAGYSASVKFTITCRGNKKTHETTTYKSTKSSTTTLSNFTIPADKLMVGSNHIEVVAVTTIGTKQTSQFTTAYDTYVADIKLDVNVTSGYYQPRTASDGITFNFTVTDSNGSTVPYTVKKRAYIGRIGPNYVSSYCNEIEADSVAGTYGNFVNTTISNNNTPMSGLPTVRFLFQAYIVDEFDNEFVSNTVMIQMLCLDGMQQTPDTVYVAAKFSDLYLQQSTLCLDYKQYSKITYPLYMYSVNGGDYAVTTQPDGGVQSTKATGTIPASELTPVEYSIVYRDPGRNIISIGSLSFDAYVTALASGMSEPTGATLNLNASEKAVGSKDDSWVDGQTSCTFNGFDWVSNGWVSTPEGTALVVNSGAALTINYTPFDRTKYNFADYPYTISFRYKITNGSDESETLISCMANDTGFTIKPQYVELKTSSAVSQNISNDDVHEVTFVYFGNSESSGLYRGLQAIYIDGTIQTIAAAGAFVPHTSSIAITATTASLYLYGVKAYRRALSFTEIQSLYCFNQSDPEAIASYVTENDVFKVNTTSIGDYGQKLDRTKLPKDSVVLVLYGRDDHPAPWTIINSYSKSEENKSAKHALAGAHLYVVGYEAHPMNFYMVGGTLGAQGTSSMAYPVKNFRLYLNKKANAGVTGGIIGYIEHFYQGTAANPLPANFDPDAAEQANLELWEKRKNKSGVWVAEYSIFSKDYLNPETGEGDPVTSAPANRFCMKADYAESSGVHNTGFARFANEIFKTSDPLLATDITSSNESSLTPPQQAVSGANPTYKKDVRMNIDGRPIYLFGVAPAHTENGVEVPETEYYLGRYNFNNDKSNVKVFGFEGVTDYEENQIVKEEGQYLQTLALQSGIDPHYAATHLAEPDDEFINPTECWEFSSNDGISREMGSFHYNKNTAFTTTLDTPDPVDGSVQALAWLNATWEYRYPDLEGKAGDLHYRRGESKPYLLYNLYSFLYDNNYDLNPSQTTLNRFADNLHYYFNVNSAVKYFVLTHWFLCMDQRIKNSMLAFWCDPYGVSAEEAASSPMHYMRAYYIFYDNDTILGLDNAGAIVNPWDLYETDLGSESLHAKSYNAFPGNGIHGLWTNLQKCYELYRDGREQLSSAYKLGSLVAQAYRNLRAKATDSVLHSYFDNKFPDAVQNVDLEVKYLNPNAIRTPEGAVELPQHLEMAQGTREFHRANLLSKRTLWLDDLYGATTYKNYMLQYKVSSTGSTDNGTIAFTINPNFRFWNFFFDYSNTIHRESGFITPGQTATLPVYSTDGFTVSDFAQISDLYACKSIDFTNYTWNPGIGQTQVDGVYPFLEDFKIHPVEGAQTVSQYGIPWASPQCMPNLKSLVCCNMVPKEGSTFGTFKLRDGNVEFTKLENLDLRGTPYSEITFPNSAALKTINLDNPVTVRLENKTNVTSINIGSTNLSSLYVRTCSSAVYGWALTAANTIYGENQKEVTIVFGEGPEHPYVITAENANQLVLLEQLASKVKLGGAGHTIVNVSGNIFTTETFDSEDVGEVFQNLNVSDQLSGEGFALTWTTDLYEDSVVATNENVDSLNCLVIRANMDVTNWSFKVDDQDGYTLNNRIKIVKTTKQRCYIHADPYEVNSQYDNKEHKIVVYAELANGDVYDTYTLTERDIMIYYQPINYLSASTETPYVTGVASPINFTFNAHTKLHMLTQAYIEANPSNFVATPTNNATVVWRYDPDGILVGANVTLSNQQDSTVNFNILGVRATITIFYDSQLVSDFDAVTTSSDLYWIKALRTALGQTVAIGSSLTKSQASKISLIDATNYLDLVYTSITDQEISTPQNFDNLQYFRLGSGTSGIFTMPPVAFTNVSFPVGTSAVEWTSLPTNTGSIGTITVRDTVKKMVVSLNADTPLTTLVIDLSATQIEKIGNYGSVLSALDNYVCSVSITFTVGVNAAMRSEGTPLFIYPGSVTLIGNIDKSISTIVDQSNPAALMFNLRPSGGNLQVTMHNPNPYPAPFALSGFINPITVGAICSYRSKGSAFARSTDWTKITKTFMSNVYDNEALITSGVFTLTSVTKVGDYTLYHDASYSAHNEQLINEVRLNANITEIGSNAFGRGNYVIKSDSDPLADTAVFNSVTSIGDAAFYLMNRPQKLQFSANLKSVGSNAFTCVDTTFDVYINKTDALQDVQPNSFGDSSSTTIIHVPAGSALYTQLTASGMDCRNRVQTF